MLVIIVKKNNVEEAQKKADQLAVLMFFLDFGILRSRSLGTDRKRSLLNCSMPRREVSALLLRKSVSMSRPRGAVQSKPPIPRMIKQGGGGGIQRRNRGKVGAVHRMGWRILQTLPYNKTALLHTIRLHPSCFPLGKPYIAEHAPLPLRTVLAARAKGMINLDKSSEKN